MIDRDALKQLLFPRYLWIPDDIAGGTLIASQNRLNALNGWVRTFSEDKNIYDKQRKKLRKKIRDLKEKV